MFLNKNKLVVKLLVWLVAAIALATSISACNTPARRLSPSASASPKLSFSPTNAFTTASKPTQTNTRTPTFTFTPIPTYAPLLTITLTPPFSLTKAPAASPTKTKLIATSTKKPIVSTTNTIEPTPTVTPSPIPPQLFDPAHISTFTPAPQAVCPTTNPDLVFNFSKAVTMPDNEYFTQFVLDFLNSGGTVQAILSAYSNLGFQVDSFVQAKDVTGDGIPELIFSYRIWIDVFGCQNAQYQQTAVLATGDSAGASIVAVTDINLDGLAEIVSYFNGCGGRCPSISVSEWNGNGFQELIADTLSASGCGRLPVAPFAVNVQDIDSNGTKEIILYNDGKLWPDIDYPYRQETRICMWNGQNLVIYDDEFDPPFYRFQAVQDGDRAFLAGKYDKALDFYQQAIFSNKLEWFTQDRRAHDFEAYSANYFPSFHTPTPTADPSILPDPNEYPYLAAYSRYRIMLLYVAEGFLKDAETVYDTLQQKFPPESPGNTFAQIASAFWKEYQSSRNLKQACSQVIAYAADHSDILGYLGDWDRGAQSIHYTPEDICPLK